MIHILSKDDSARDADAVAAAVRAEGRSVAMIRTTHGVEVGRLLHEQFDEIEHLIVVGGDGLIHLAAQVMAQSGKPFGIVPAGTGNDIARGLGLRKQRRHGVVSAARRALEPATPMDLIKVGDTWAVSVVTAGFSGRVNHRANRSRLPIGRFKYTAATLRELTSLHPSPMMVTDSDGRGSDEATLLIAIGNTSYFGGGMAICPGADPVDGNLQVVTIGPVPRRTFARVLPRAFNGGHLRHRAVSDVMTPALRLQTDVSLWADGEPLDGDASSGIAITCVPEALLVAGFRPT